jgi:hypothetical protein
MFSWLFLAKSLVSRISPLAWGVISLGVVCAALSGSLYLAKARIDRLNQELGQAELLYVTAKNVNAENQVSMEVISAELARCAGMREEARDRATIAILELSKLQREAYELTVDRSTEADEDMVKSNACDNAVIPPRTLGLLIEAANSANRDTGGH